MGIFNLHGRVAVVTGGTAGLGRGMAIALARQGADLAILARRPDKLTETAREIESLGGRCLPVVCDISDEASVQNAVETVVNHYKKVDILVNNAGNGGPSIPTVDMPQEIFDKVVNLDLCSLFRVMKAIVQQAPQADEHSQSHHKGGHLAPGVPQAVERAHQHAGADGHGENGPGAKVGGSHGAQSGREGGIGADG